MNTAMQCPTAGSSQDPAFRISTAVSWRAPAWDGNDVDMNSPPRTLDNASGEAGFPAARRGRSGRGNIRDRADAPARPGWPHENHRAEGAGVDCRYMCLGRDFGCGDRI